MVEQPQPAPYAPEANVPPPPVRHGFYLRASVGLGGGGYVYANGRSGGGFLMTFNVAIGGNVGHGVVVGGTASFDPIFAVSGHSSNGTPFSSSVAPNGYIGPMVAFVGERFSLELPLVFGGGGTSGTGPPAYGAGGSGVVFAPHLAIWLPSTRRSHLGFHVRPVLGYLLDPALPGVAEGFLSIDLGVSYMFY